MRQPCQVPIGNASKTAPLSPIYRLKVKAKELFGRTVSSFNATKETVSGWSSNTAQKTSRAVNDLFSSGLNNIKKLVEKGTKGVNSLKGRVKASFSTASTAINKAKAAMTSVAYHVFNRALALFSGRHSEKSTPSSNTTTPLETRLYSSNNVITIKPEAPAAPSVAPEGSAIAIVLPEAPVAPSVAPEGSAAPSVLPEAPAAPSVAPEGSAASKVDPVKSMSTKTVYSKL